MWIIRFLRFLRTALTAVFLTLMAGSTAFGAHPLFTDDTGTQGKGKFQLEMNGEAARDKETLNGVETREDARELAVILSAGAADSVDIVVLMPWLWARVKENGTTVSDESGAGDASLELKWRFLESGGFSLAVKPGLILPTGNEKKGLGNGRPSYGWILIATQEFERSFIHFNVGYVRNKFGLEADRGSNRRDFWNGSVAAGVDIVKSLTLVANIGAETNGDKGSDTWPAFLLGGFIYSVTEGMDVDLGIKTGLNRSAADLAVLAGVAWRF
jgi:Putative MetA-pathway of phenol degradation